MPLRRRSQHQQSPSVTIHVLSLHIPHLLDWQAGREVVDAAAELEPTAAKPKRRKGAAAATAPAAGVTEEPLSRFEGHLHCVSSVSYPSGVHGGELLTTGAWTGMAKRQGSC